MHDVSLRACVYFWVLWYVLSLATSRSTPHSGSELQWWQLLQIGSSQDLVLLVALRPVHGLCSVICIHSGSDFVSDNSYMFCHMQDIPLHHVLFHSSRNWTSCLEVFFSSLSEGVFLSVDLSFSLPIPCNDESLSSSFICISMASTDHTTSNAFFLSQCTLSNLSFVYTKYNSVLDEADCYKYLGVIINETLTWGDHVNYISTKVNQWLGILIRIKHL